MTQGTLVIKNGKQFNAWFMYSDSYLCADADSYCGIIVDAFKSGNFVGTIMPILENDASFEKESCTTPNFWVRSRKTADYSFADYAYVYDVKSDSLTIYYFGDKAITFSREQIDYLDYLAANHNDIYALSFNYDKLAYNCFDKACKEFAALMNAGASIADIKAKIASELAKQRINVGTGRWADVRPNNIKKEVVLNDVDGNKVASFFLILEYSNYSKKYTLYIQTPDCRRYIDAREYSKRAGLKRLYEICRSSEFVGFLSHANTVFKSANIVQEKVREFFNTPREQRENRDKFFGGLYEIANNANESLLSPYLQISEKSLLRDIVSHADLAELHETLQEKAG